MGKGIYFDIEQASVASSAFQKVITFTVPAPAPVRILDISLNPDSSFSGSGTFGLFIGGQTNTGSGKALPAAVDIPVWAFQNEVNLPDGRKAKGLILNPGETIEVYAAMSSGTGILTALVTGEIV